MNAHEFHVGDRVVGYWWGYGKATGVLEKMDDGQLGFVNDDGVFLVSMAHDIQFEPPIPAPPSARMLLRSDHAAPAHHRHSFKGGVVWDLYQWFECDCGKMELRDLK